MGNVKVSGQCVLSIKQISLTILTDLLGLNNMILLECQHTTCIVSHICRELGILLVVKMKGPFCQEAILILSYTC